MVDTLLSLPLYCSASVVTGLLLLAQRVPHGNVIACVVFCYKGVTEEPS